MTTEDQGTLPVPQPAGDPILSLGLSIAAQWGARLDPPQLEVALKALEPQLRREHKERLLRLEMQRDVADRDSQEKRDTSERAAWESREERSHKRYLATLMTGGIVAIAMLGAGVAVAQDQWWLSILLCGPSLIALSKIIFLRRSDDYDMKAVLGSTRTGINAAGQTQPPQPPPPVI
ncbi:hypothetical protein ABTX82_37765 [Streptomyces lavendulae]|uniref:hypothetical protein n=1 Tax=Streptomyces lavendulae TaxID=1914 RepID=UPI00331F70E9